MSINRLLYTLIENHPMNIWMGAHMLEPVEANPPEYRRHMVVYDPETSSKVRFNQAGDEHEFMFKRRCIQILNQQPESIEDFQVYWRFAI